MKSETRRLVVCHGKYAYPSFDAAAVVASLQAHRKKRRISPYKCPMCGQYHVGENLPGRSDRTDLQYKKRRAQRRERRIQE